MRSHQETEQARGARSQELCETCLNDHVLKKDDIFIFFDDSKNLATSSQGLRIEISETGRRDMKRESLDAPIQPSHFRSGSGIWIILVWNLFSRWYDGLIRGFFLRNGTLKNFLTLWNLKAGRFTSELKFVCERLNLRSQCCGSKKVKWQNQLTNLLHRDRSQDSAIFLISRCNDCVSLKKLINTQSTFRKRVSKSNELNIPTDSYEEDKIAYKI